MKEIIPVYIDEILINPENPRHNAVQITMPEFGEMLVMKQLVHNKETANKMFELINGLYQDGFLPTMSVILEYKEDIKKYIPWDGNRRITALKILQNPDIMQELKYFSYSQMKTVGEFSKIVQKDFYEIPAYIVQSFEEAAPMIKALHTSVSGGLPWDRNMIKRFEQKLGIKNSLTQIQELFPKVFRDLPDNFPTSVLEKILKSKEGKKFLKIDDINNFVTITSSINDTEEKLEKVVSDIKEGKINSNTVQNNKKIRESLNGDDKEELLVKKKVLKEDGKEKNEEKKSIENTKTENKNKEIFEQTSFLENQNLDTSTNVPTIKKDDIIKFANLNVDKLDKSNERASGIHDLASELQISSKRNGYKFYPISYCFLVRALLEQSSIYFLMKIGKWEVLQKGKTRDSNLGEIIGFINKNKENFFMQNLDIKREWNIVFENQSFKDYLDLVIHHPYKISPNREYLRILADTGLYAIIQFFIDCGEQLSIITLNFSLKSGIKYKEKLFKR